MAAANPAVLHHHIVCRHLCQSLVKHLLQDSKTGKASAIQGLWLSTLCKMISVTELAAKVLPGPAVAWTDKIDTFLCSNASGIEIHHNSLLSALCSIALGQGPLDYGPLAVKAADCICLTIVLICQHRMNKATSVLLEDPQKNIVAFIHSHLEQQKEQQKEQEKDNNKHASTASAARFLVSSCIVCGINAFKCSMPDALIMCAETVS